jgi:leucyl-tRNA synthetase
VPDKDLPVVLPRVENFQPKGRSPLADQAEFMKTTCPKCGGPAQRDPDTMDTFMDSSWYLYRYVDPKNSKEPWSKDEIRKWLPVDLYIGGAGACVHAPALLPLHRESAVRRRLGPDRRAGRHLYHQGMVCDEHGDIMSKSKGNAISPSEIMDQWGVDVCRLAMFAFAPSDIDIKWKQDGLSGAHRLVTRLWDLFETIVPKVKDAKGKSGATSRSASRPT